MDRFSSGDLIWVTWTEACFPNHELLPVVDPRLNIWLDIPGFDEPVGWWGLSDAQLTSRKRQVKIPSVQGFPPLVYFSIDCGMFGFNLESERFLIDPPQTSGSLELQPDPSKPILQFNTETDCPENLGDLEWMHDLSFPWVLGLAGCELARKIGVQSLRATVNCPGCNVQYGFVASRLYYSVSTATYDLELTATASIDADFDVDFGFAVSFPPFSLLVPLIPTENFPVVLFDRASFTLGLNFAIQLQIQLNVEAQGRLTIPIHGDITAYGRAKPTYSVPTFSCDYTPRQPRTPTVHGLSGEIKPVLSVIPFASIGVPFIVSLTLSTGFDVIFGLSFQYPAFGPKNRDALDPYIPCESCFESCPVEHYFEWTVSFQFTGIKFEITVKDQKKVFPLVGVGKPILLVWGCFLTASETLAATNLLIAAGNEFEGDVEAMLSSLRVSIADALSISAAQVFCQVEAVGDGAQKVLVRLIPDLVDGATSSQTLVDDLVAYLGNSQLAGPLREFVSIEDTQCAILSVWSYSGYAGQFLLQDYLINGRMAYRTDAADLYIIWSSSNYWIVTDSNNPDTETIYAMSSDDTMSPLDADWSNDGSVECAGNTCDVFSCPLGSKLNSNAKNTKCISSSSNTCTAKLCCTVTNGLCSKFKCSKGLVLRLDAATTVCRKKKCILAECCVGVCSKYKCPSRTVRIDPSNVPCAKQKCTADECCKGLCSSVKCPRNHVRVTPANTRCAARVCSREECCLGNCYGFKCPKPQKRVSNPKNVVCPSFDCQTEDCCQPCSAVTVNDADTSFWDLNGRYDLQTDGYLNGRPYYYSSELYLYLYYDSSEMWLIDDDTDSSEYFAYVEDDAAQPQKISETWEVYDGNEFSGGAAYVECAGL